MSWVPRILPPLFRALRFGRRAARVISRVGRRGRIQAMKYPVTKPGKKLVERHVKKPKALVNKKSTVRIDPMPFYRRRFVRRRRPVFRRRKYVKKTANKIHTFVRWCDKDTTYGENGPNTITEGTSAQHLTYQFKLDNVSGVTDFTNLYDGYKINKIQLFLEPFIDQSSGPTPIAYQQRIRVVHDYNDATPLTDEDEYLQYGNCKSYVPFTRNGIRITLYPKLNNVIENVAGGANGFTSMNSNRQFLNIATDEVPHFGIKMFIPNGLAADGTTLFRVRAKYWLSMRGTK